MNIEGNISRQFMLLWIVVFILTIGFFVSLIYPYISIRQEIAPIKDNIQQLSLNDANLLSLYKSTYNSSQIIELLEKARRESNYNYANLWLLTLDQGNRTKFGHMDSAFSCKDRRQLDYVQFSSHYLVTDFTDGTRIIYNLVSNETVCSNIVNWKIFQRNLTDCVNICKDDRI